MQILYAYTYPAGTMKEFDYLQDSLVLYINASPLMLDTMPIIPREPEYQVKKPRGSYADNPII